MATSINEMQAASALLRLGTAETAIILRRRLLVEIMPSILHELSQPLTCIMLQQAACRRALHSGAANAEDALRKAGHEARRASAIVQIMNLLSSDQSEPVTGMDLNTLVGQAAELLRRYLYDHRCTLDLHMAPLPDACFSPTTVMEAILRAIVMGSRSRSPDTSRMSVDTKLSRDGRHVQLICRSIDQEGVSRFSTVTSCSNYAHIAEAIRSGGGQIRLCGDKLIIELPVANGPDSDAVDDRN